MPVYRAGTSLGTTEPGIRRRDRRLDVAADFGGACQATNQAFSILVGPDRDDLGDLAIAVEDDNRFPARGATNELTGPIAELADLDALHIAIVAKILGQVEDRCFAIGPDRVISLLGTKGETVPRLARDSDLRYPALYRLEANGRVTASWEKSDKGKRARYYRITPLGRKQLASEHSKWDPFARAMGLLLQPTAEEG